MALFGKKEPPARPVEDMAEELKALLAKATDERTKISSLLGRTKGSVEKLEKLDTPLRAVVEKADIVAEQIKRLEDRAKSLDPLITRLDQVGQRAASVEAGQEALEGRITKANAEVADVLAVASGLREDVAKATQVRNEIQSATAPGGSVAELRGKLDELRGQFLTYGHDVAQTRESQESLKRVQEE